MIIDAATARHEFYGRYLDESNLFMPVGHLIPIMQQASNRSMAYRGMPLNQHPCDAWVYQEIIFETQPQTIIEIGGGVGGSAWWLSDLLKTLVPGANGVVSIDTESPDQKCPDVYYVQGDSQNEGVISSVSKAASIRERVMVIDDCSHTVENVLENLVNYGRLVTPGCYYIVEDTILGYGLFHPGHELAGNRPLDGVDQYTAGNQDFEIDRTREKFFVTACPKGFLRKVAA